MVTILSSLYKASTKMIKSGQSLSCDIVLGSLVGSKFQHYEALSQVYISKLFHIKERPLIRGDTTQFSNNTLISITFITFTPHFVSTLCATTSTKHITMDQHWSDIHRVSINSRSLSVRQRNAILMAFRWWVDSELKLYKLSNLDIGPMILNCSKVLLHNGHRQNKHIKQYKLHCVT